MATVLPPLPADWPDAPEGRERYWKLANADWRAVPPEEARPCRRGASPGARACGRSSVIAFLRGYMRPSWWHYCELHTYGRIVVDGEVYSPAIRKVT